MKTNSIKISEILTVKEVSQLFKVSERTIYRLIHNQALPFFPIGKSIRFSMRDLEVYLENVKKN